MHCVPSGYAECSRVLGDRRSFYLQKNGACIQRHDHLISTSFFIYFEIRNTMNTIFVLPSYTSDSVSLIAYQYVQALVQRGHEVGITSIRRSALQKGPEFFYVSIFHIFRCNTIVTNLFLPDLLGFLISHIHPRIKWVAFLHCDVIGGLAAEAKPFAKVKAWLWRLVLSRAESVISPSHYALKRLSKLNNITIIQHCINPVVERWFRANALINASKPKRTDYPHSAVRQPSYVFIGRDTRAKRLFVLFDLLRADPNCRVKVIGTIAHSSSRVAQLSQEERARCTFYGYQSDPYQFLDSKDTVICPSGREGFGLIPVECFARDIAVAVINEGVFKELYGNSSIAYFRISDLQEKIPNLTQSMQILKAKYVGEDALSKRVDQLVVVLFKR